MKPIALVSGWNLLPFIGFLTDIGAPVERWLEESRIPVDVIHAPDLSIPFSFALDFGERAARAEGAESLGIDVGRSTAAESLGPWGLRLARCPTLYDRAQSACQLLSRLNTCATMWLEEDGPWVRLHERFDADARRELRHCEDFSLMLILEAVGRAAESAWRPEAIHLPGKRRERFARDEMFRDVRMVYGARDVAVVFSRDLLSRPLAPLSTRIATDRRAPELFHHHVPALDFVGSLEDTIASLLPRGCPSIDEIAEIAQTSARTLQRELSSADTSLRRIIDRVRYRLAAEYLRDPTASITEIALELGYGDSTAFSRAFHRIAGVSPSAYRSQLGNP